MAFTVTFVKNRTSDDTITLYESDGTTGITLAATDVVRFKMYRRDTSTPDLDIDSAADSTNGSGITVDQLASAAIATLRIAQADTAGLVPGPYRAEILVVDDSETTPANAVKSAEQGVAYVLSSGGGDVGLT